MVTFQEYKGLMPYTRGLDMMHAAVEQVLSGEREVIILMEHADVYTGGTGSKDEEVLGTLNDIPRYQTGRGGKWTYHGPGQRVIYPILDLSAPHRQKDIKLYVSLLEHWIIKTLECFSIEAFIMPGRVGIWTRKSGQYTKIGAIGVRVKKWVTYHGVAVNICSDLAKFNAIIPCGIKDASVTSMHDLGVTISLEEFDAALKTTVQQFL